MEKYNEELYDKAVKDFFSKFPDKINSYDFWVRFGQSLIEFSDKKSPVKSISHLVGNAIVDVLDERKKLNE